MYCHFGTPLVWIRHCKSSEYGFGEILWSEVMTVYRRVCRLHDLLVRVVAY